MKMNKLLALLIIALMCSSTLELVAQKRKNRKDEKFEEKAKHPLDELSLSALKFRSVGPANTSGRISDFAVHPEMPHIYYVATSSGGVWKTVNSGTTYEPIFDSQGSYSIGCVTMDPNNASTIWVGTGENNNQRSVAYGDGVYMSKDAGASWKNMGLKESEHISKIIVHPNDSNTIWVAAVGPLWSSGGERGVYKSTDGGQTWNPTLSIDEYTGVADMIIHPNDPNVLYAATHQRARHVFTYLGGGPGSAIYKSVDGGDTWEKASNGLPDVDLGRIGLAVSPADPEKLYAIIEAAEGKSGFYRSTNRGASWHKQGGHVTSGNYYQEIVADPTNADIIYSMDTWLSKSVDGGKTFQKTGEVTKHVDNHCIWVNPNNNEHWLVGCDGGIYETWDAAKTWSFKANLPIVQFYKVAVDNDTPFYNIYGGTQDNFSMGGPSRTNTAHGIVNSDWYITHGGDGFESQVDPENPNIVYAQSQYGVLVRYDRLSGEEVGIQPKERKNENAYRWNWDAPLHVSAHKSGRLFFAANKVFRSDDYGNSWEVISDDLTQQINRNELKIMDRVWSIDAVAKNGSTSPYGTLVAFSESTLDENLLVVGSDDGLIHVSTDGGANWKKSSSFPGVPRNTYVNSVFCSNHNASVIYAAFNNHKNGDFKPYLYKSIDKGTSWQKISNNLPERGSTYSIVEDHKDENLLFCGTEFGAFFSTNGGGHWKQLKGGLPTIAVRDIAIQERENDLVLGTFGRGFYVLDDYSCLRQVGDGKMGDVAQIFPIRNAYVYEEAVPLGLPGKSFQGDSYYSAENLGSVALIDYYIPESFKNAKDERIKKAAKAAKEGRDNPYPSYEQLLAESEEVKEQLIFSISNANGETVRKIYKSPKEGVHRIKWDLRSSSTAPINLNKPSFYNPFAGVDQGPLVQPGKYIVTLSKITNGETQVLVDQVAFTVVPLEDRVMPATDLKGKKAFQDEVAELSRQISGAGKMISEVSNKMKHINAAIQQTNTKTEELHNSYNEINKNLREIRTALYGDNIKTRLDIDQPPTPAGRIGWIEYEQGASTAAPTGTHRMSYQIAKEEFEPILSRLKTLVSTDLEELEQMLEDADAPYTPGRAVKMIE
jgi:photosystem II stability/assembly factor-like uncharacterized protein/uncharacterized protein YukE